MTIQRALFSVTDKTGLEVFARGLRKANPELEIVASGGTAKMLTEAKLPFTPLSEKTKFPECFGGRVKTLHPTIFGGILFRRGSDEEEAKKLHIQPIDLVVCNLYAFEKASQDADLEMSKLIESVDIGGSALIRSACKNYTAVAVVVDPEDYPTLLEEFNAHGTLSLKTREKLAVKAMRMSAAYEARIAEEFAKRLSNEKGLNLQLHQGMKLSYGENPDQEAWVYSFEGQGGIAAAKVLGGKPLSYNNYEDASQAFLAMQRFYEVQGGSLAAIVKHGSLCGFASGRTLQEAFKRAWDGDPKSAFGSIVVLTQEVSEEFCKELKDNFIEVLIAPAFSPKFLEWVRKAKPALRLLQVSFESAMPWLFRSIAGGMLMQTPKRGLFSSLEKLLQPLDQKMGVATKRQPKHEQLGLFRFAIAMVQAVKSNAIVLAREYVPGHYQLIGVGGGQPNRVDSLQRLALPKAFETLQREFGEIQMREVLKDAVLASDGFFPFPDSVTFAAEQGVQTCLQPGGSIRDQDVIDAADEYGICMIFTGQRYFNH